MKNIEKEGDKCPLCNHKVYKVLKTDLRDKELKKNYPLTKEDLTVLACPCFHPGDFYVGGFF